MIHFFTSVGIVMQDVLLWKLCGDYAISVYAGEEFIARIDVS
jgi:hypothetical protein